MRTRIAIGLVTAAWWLLACGEAGDSENGVDPIEAKGWEASGIDPDNDRSNLHNAPRLSDEDDRGVPMTISKTGGLRVRTDEYAAMDINGNRIGDGGPIMKPGQVRQTERMVCTRDGTCEYITGFFDSLGNRIPDAIAERMGLPVNDLVQAMPKDFWAEGVAVAPTGTSKPAAPAAVPTEVCTGLPDACYRSEPWCNGGAGVLSPGGIAESGIGCRGTSIIHGGPGEHRPDNGDVRVTWWSGILNSCNDTSFAAFPDLKYVFDRINAHNDLLPPPWQLSSANCQSDGLPRGYGLCADGVHVCPWPQNTGHGTLVDVMVQLDDLSDVNPQHYCEEARNTQAGYNRADARTIGCTSRVLEMDGNTGFPLIRTWNNGSGITQYYWTMRGAILTVDPEGIEWMVDYPADVLDRGGLNKATRRAFFNIHVIAHEIGHNVGLRHAYIGGDGSPRWVPHSHLSSSLTPNPNIVPLSVMARLVPAAPYTTADWASGLLLDLVTYNDATAGQGNAEAWKLSNQFRAVTDGFTTFPKNYFGAPITETTLEK